VGEHVKSYHGQHFPTFRKYGIASIGDTVQIIGTFYTDSRFSTKNLKNEGEIID
jgi:hypothetical protein